MKRMFVSILIVAMISTLFHGIVGGGQAAAADAPSDFDDLRLKWETMLTGGTDFDPNYGYISDRIADIDTAARGQALCFDLLR